MTFPTAAVSGPGMVPKAVAADISLCMRNQHSAIAAALCVVSACGLIASPAGVEDPARPRAFVSTFDRVLIAGFLAETVADRGRDIDLNVETARLLRGALRSGTSVNVIDSGPVHLPLVDAKAPNPEKYVFNDVAFWKRLGEEYREPLILTGTVAFKRAGSQSAERQIGPRSITVWRPRYKLDLHLVFICGRTGQVLDSLSAGPAIMQAQDDRTSAFSLYLELMDRLTPRVLAVFGSQFSAPRS